MYQSSRLPVLVALTLSACGGGGDGGGGGDPPIEATLASIQSNVFTPICAQCHAGAGAPQGLRLEAGASHAMLVNVPSVEVPALLRVAPGNPGESYLIQKVEGTAAVGGRMPLNGSPLPQSTITAIRQWITNGAPAATAVSSNARAPTLELLTPWPETDLQPEDVPPVAELLVASDQALDITLLDAATVTLEGSGGDGDFGDGNEISIALRIVVTQQAPTVLRLIPRAPLGADRYRLTISGSPPLALADLGAIPVDGDRDGIPGGDFIAEFAGGIQR